MLSGSNVPKIVVQSDRATVLYSSKMLKQEDVLNAQKVLMKIGKGKNTLKK